MADLTVTITEDLTINSAEVGGSNTKTITGITDAYKRTITCTNGQETTIATFAANEYTSAGALDLGNVKYLRITNVDTTNEVEVGYVLDRSGGGNFQITVKSGDSHILYAAEQIATIEADTSPAFGELDDISSIIVRPVQAADVRVELFVASI